MNIFENYLHLIGIFDKHEQEKLKQLHKKKKKNANINIQCQQFFKD